MDDKQLALLLTAMSDQTAAMNRQADALTGILLHLDPKQAAKFAAPGYKRRLAEYAGFDWESIGATVIATDRWGATEVEYNGQSFRRYRSNDDDPKGVDIRFNRVVSGTVDGKDMVWASLIKFFDPKPKDPPRPLRGELAETITAAQQQKQPIAVAIAPTAKLNGKPAALPSEPTEVQVTAKAVLDRIAKERQSLTVTQSRQANARAVALATSARLDQKFIDAHDSPNSEISGVAMVTHAEALLNAVVAGKVPEPIAA